MRRKHGEASPLLLDEEIDFSAFDRILDSGAANAETVRLSVANTFLGPNRFGRLFPRAERFRPSAESLVALAETLRQEPETDPGQADPAGDNTDVPAGFTYLGQFIDHDITLDPTIGFPPVEDPENLISLRTPRLELDSVYGMGPVDQPEFYDPAFPTSEARFNIGKTTVPSTGDPDGVFDNDLHRRTGDKSAIIGDGRNDENLIIAQLHLAFLKFHNKVIATLGPVAGSEPPFEVARRLVRWHYQWIVLHDFLPRMLDQAVLADIRTNGRRFYRFDEAPFNGTPYMPVEFSVAAYRMGHSLIRNAYNFNRVFSNDPGALTDATLNLLFRFTGARGLGGSETLPSNWIIDWRRFFELADRDLLNFARLMDTALAHELTALPDISPDEEQSVLASLAARNLLRGRIVGLPTGQDVAEVMELKPLSAEDLRRDESDVVGRLGFDLQTPLWFYILKEAAVQSGGRHLGAVGSRIVGEVFVGMLEGDPSSFLHAEPDWTPTLGEHPGSFSMADLLAFVGEINPIGEVNPA